MASPSPATLDLHSLAVLTVYEATAYEPRFRHAKLLEITDTARFASVAHLYGDPAFANWCSRKDVVRRGYLFETPGERAVGQPDAPANMIQANFVKGVHPSIVGLSEKEKEAVFYQARMHVGFVCVA